MTTYYLAGPMTGIPQFNFPAFIAAAKDLRENDIDVVSPAELDDKRTFDAAMQSIDGAPGSAGKDTWGDFLARDVKLIADRVDGLILLPGWEHSRGALLEAFVSILCGHKLMTYSLFTGLYSIRAEILIAEIHEATLERIYES